VPPTCGGEDGVGISLPSERLRVCVHGFGGRDGLLDGVEKTDELLMAMALHAPSDHLALQHVEGREQGGRAVALVVVVMVPARPRFRGNPGCVRSSAWIWLFSSIDKTTA
jgi:hypothetical protein